MAGQLEKGSRVGKYEIRGRLGKGGMASVYRAYDPNLDREVAIKVIADQFANDPAFVERFRREARSIARLRHPNILTIYDFGEENGALYIVMEIIEGQTLKEEQEGKVLTLDRTHEIIKQVAGALDYANKNGIIHRDVKPSNILIDAHSNRAVLSDFGIAKMAAEVDSKLTGTGTGVGTPDYMSPEQAMGDELDSRSDQYSLAIVAYELLTGRPPFTGDTPIAVAMGHVSKPLPKPSQFNPNIPINVEQVLIKALAKKPIDRYESCGVFERALSDGIRAANAIGGETVAVQTASMKRVANDNSSPSLMNPEAESLYQNARRFEQTNNFMGAFRAFNELNYRFPNYRDVNTVLDRYRVMGYDSTLTGMDGKWSGQTGTAQSQPSYPGTIPPINTGTFPQGPATYIPLAQTKKGSPLPLILGGVAALAAVAVAIVLLLVLTGGNKADPTITVQAIKVTNTPAVVATTAPVAATTANSTTAPISNPTTPAVVKTTPGTTGPLTYKPYKAEDGGYTVDVPDSWVSKSIPQTNFSQDAFNPPEGDFYVTVQLVKVALPGTLDQTALDGIIKAQLQATNATITSNQKVTVSGVETTMGIGTLKDGAITFNMKYVAFAKNEKLWFILYGVSPDRAKTYDAVFDRFLSSFKVN